MLIYYMSANYNGSQPNNTSYIKTFVSGPAKQFWKMMPHNSAKTLTPLYNDANVLIKNDLYLEGSFFNTSDLRLKENIFPINNDFANNILRLRPCEYTFKDDESQRIHYGFIAQEIKEVFPQLVSTKPKENKGKEGESEDMVVNLLEMVPFIVQKMKHMQKELDNAKERISTLERRLLTE